MYSSGDQYTAYLPYVKRGYIAVPVYKGSLAEAKKGACKQTKPFQSGDHTQKTYNSVTHFRHADTNLAIPRTSAWFMKCLRRGTLLQCADVNMSWT
eukprot:1160420-Pelagomonas_calceolata.AAC.13